MRRVRVTCVVLVAYSATAQGGTLDRDLAGFGFASASIAATHLVEGPNLATTFGIIPTLTADPGLADSRAGAKLLIIPEDTGCDAGICDAPDDVAVRSASNLKIALATPVYVFGSDPIDVENTTEQNGSMVTHDGGASAFPSWLFRGVTDSLAFDLN